MTQSQSQYDLHEIRTDSDIVEFFHRVAMESHASPVSYLMFLNIQVHCQLIDLIFSHITFSFSPTLKAIYFQFVDDQHIVMYIDHPRREKVILSQSFAARVDHCPTDPAQIDQIDQIRMDWLKHLAECRDTVTALESIPMNSIFSRIRYCKYEEHHSSM
jgi:hypothetical protein